MFLAASPPRLGPQPQAPPEHGAPAPCPAVLLIAAVDPLGEVGTLRPDGGVEAVAGHDDRVGGEGEEPLVERLDDGGEVAAVGGVAGPAGEQRVAGEKDGPPFQEEAD